MKFILVALLTMSSAFASDLCSRYDYNIRYVTAIETLAKYLAYDLDEMCNLPSVLDIEVQPTQVINRKGEVEPHVRIEFHKSYSSCYYLVRDLDQEITKSRCYSTF